MNALNKSELRRFAGFRGSLRASRCRPFLWAVMAVLLALVSPAPLRANPSGGNVVVPGSATISQIPGTTTINQTAAKTIINWNSFSIANGELTQFIQPDKNAIALNRVVNNVPNLPAAVFLASQIDGSLTANGHVWLVNQNGILLAPLRPLMCRD